MPIRYRNWFIDRLTREFENRRAAMSDAAADVTSSPARPKGMKHF